MEHLDNVFRDILAVGDFVVHGHPEVFMAGRTSIQNKADYPDVKNG